MCDVYCYGMILKSNSFLMENGFLKPDAYSEIRAKYEFPGGETGTCATVLSSLGVSVRLAGTHIGYQAEKLVREFYKDKKVNMDSLYFDKEYEGLEDYIIIAGDTRSPMGTFGQFFGEAFSGGVRHFSKPAKEDIRNCKVAAIDPFFGEESDLAAAYCVEHKKPYVTVDCPYDSYIHKNAAISVISGEGIQNNHPGMTREELFPLYQQNSDGLTIITNGGKPFCYGRKGESMKVFEPYKVKVISTLGAGDSFKAGCVYALLKGMKDEEAVEFASACAGVAISRFPMQINPPTLEEILKLCKERKK